MTSRWAAVVEWATLASTSRSVTDIARGGAGADILHSTPRGPNYLRDTPLGGLPQAPTKRTLSLPDLTAGRHIGIKVLGLLYGYPTPKVTRLGRTFRGWRHAFLLYFHYKIGRA